MRPNKPQSKSQPDTTINSELRYDPQGAEKAVTTMKLADVRKKHPSLDKEITNLIAQEANKAVVAELERMLPDGATWVLEPGDEKWMSYVSERIEALTADKEQA